VTEDRRNSFALADERALAAMRDPLVVTVHLAPEDPRYIDLRRNVLAKLQRVMSNTTIRLAGDRQTFAAGSQDETYGTIEFVYASRSDTTRSTSPREILPLLYGLAGREPPTPVAGADYPGYPLVAGAQGALVWFFGGLPLLIIAAWWWSRRPPRLARIPVLKEV
jgi:ABC-2 type transport system permease protein